ncbi:MAG: hypothetical protein GXY05_04050 [Clostridiales bacterium]|nr:hypothetical protein [Clostridiales bacterium]
MDGLYQEMNEQFEGKKAFLKDDKIFIDNVRQRKDALYNLLRGFTKKHPVTGDRSNMHEKTKQAMSVLLKEHNMICKWMDWYEVTRKEVDTGARVLSHESRKSLIDLYLEAYSSYSKELEERGDGTVFCEYIGVYVYCYWPECASCDTYLLNA